MMGPSAQALSEDERLLRSRLIAVQLMGLAFMRFVWKIEPLASANARYQTLKRNSTQFRY
jgi:hypothetical protein